MSVEKKPKAWDVGGTKEFRKMHQQPRLFLTRFNPNEFKLARGYCIGFGCAIVRVQEKNGTFNFEGPWHVIDYASGLKVRGGFTKIDDGVGYMNQHFMELEERLNEARKGKTYHERVLDYINEKEIWRQSGYEIF